MEKEGGKIRESKWLGGGREREEMGGSTFPPIGRKEELFVLVVGY